MRLCLIASKPTDSVILGFLPAAARLGLEVVLLTDQPEEHERALARSRRLPRPGCPRPQAGPSQGARHADGPPVRFLGCDVWDARELICAIAGRPAPHAIVSNSDHLQTQTALAAAYFGLPGKDWRSAMRAKNKSLMRRRLAETGTEHVASAEIRAGDDPPDGLRYPVVLKPAEGVASEDVMLVISPEELAERSARIHSRRPGETLLAEEYLSGELHTLETLGDGSGLGARRVPHQALAAALLHRGAAHLGRARARRGPGPRARRARRARRHVRRVPHRVRRRQPRARP